MRIAFHFQLSITACARLAVILGSLFGLAETFAATPEHGSVSTLDGVTVIGITALSGAGQSPSQLAGNIQSASSDDLERMHALDITEHLTRTMASVFANDAQGNPLQRDLQVRGFVASPLLGLSQGISVYQDGVRVNEPFGDTVNWALIPDNAIANIDLIPGSNPLFGLNTLGGALVVRTKNGFTHPGVSAEASYGSAQRITVESSAGEADADTAYFIAASHSQEAGWRYHSPTHATQAFADVRQRYAAGETSLSLTYATTDLIGNGPLPDSLLAQNRRDIFTRPDRTQNNLWLFSVGSTYRTGDKSKFILRAYQRRSDVAGLNGDDSNFEECALIPGIVCQPNQVDDPALDRLGNAISFTPQVDGAALNRSKTSQLGRGLAVQWENAAQLFGRDNRLVLGVSNDRGIAEFASSTELGALDATRQAIGSGRYVAQADVDLTTRATDYSALFSNTVSLPHAAVTIAGRYYRQEIELRDRLGTALNGNHRFTRFNPSLGLVAPFTKTVSLYASYAQSSRTPSPVELTCANPNDPCRLPNAFLSDPPLSQVVAETVEAGVRGATANRRWHVGAFRTTNRDDILFVSAGALTNQGYFTNVKATRRQGVELLLAGTSFVKLNWFMNYTWLAASFQDDLTIASAHNPRATNGVINVQHGDRLPGIPQQLAKLGFDYELDQWSVAVDTHYASSQYARGDEANLLAPLPGYFTVNAQTGYQKESALITFGIHNLFDRQYSTFATLGNADNVLGTTVGNERFSTPAAPRSLWLAIRVKL